MESGKFIGLITLRELLKGLNTHGSNSSASRLAVHPRACGEQGPKSELIAASVRFIPARAGNSA